MSRAPDAPAPAHQAVARFVDLHCHCMPGIDDGARTAEEGTAILSGLAALGFSTVIATPHMRPGLFDTNQQELRAAFEAFRLQPLPVELFLSCEHYFDSVVLARLDAGQALPYPGERAVLLEFYDCVFAPGIEQVLAGLSRRGLRPVIAHPERYAAFWSAPERLERWLDVGAVALLDAAALVGKYGRAPQQAAERLLDRGAYLAACSDAHRPKDVDALATAIELIQARYGAEEVGLLFDSGPREILRGRLEATP